MCFQVADLAGHQIGLRRPVVADGNVRLAPPEIAFGIGGDNFDIDARRSFPDLTNDRRQRKAASVSLALIDTVPSTACALPEAASDIRSAASPMTRT
jgi:hypothetical protein